MTQFDADFDYLLLLGIEPSDAARNAPGLPDQIKQKKKEWTAQALNPLYQQAARSNLERAREFEELLKEPPALAAYANHIQQIRLSRRAEHEELVGSMIAFAAAGKKEISAKQRDLIARELKAEGVPEGVLDSVLKARNYTVNDRKAPAAAAEKPKLPLKTPALDGTILNEIQNWLKVLGKRSLYELLDLPDATPPQRLVSTAQVLFLHWSKVLPKTTTSTAWEKTLQAATTYLKDAESKARYDRGLWNLRIQLFAKRIDLVLAASSLNPDDLAHLTRVGVEDFGFAQALVDQCLVSRMAEKGLSIETRPVVKLRLDGQVRCRRCSTYNTSRAARCRECGGSLHRKCENPSCSGGPIPDNAKICPSCGLPVMRGTQYRTLLKMADAFLSTGNHGGADSVCRLADQILPSAAINERLVRSAKIRELTARAREHAAAKAWNAVRADLKELLPLAPRLTILRVPPLEKIAAYQATWMEKILALAPETPPIEAAKVYLGCLRQWSDCEEAYQRLWGMCKSLEQEKRPRAAWQIAMKLAEIRPGDAEVHAFARHLEPEVKRIGAIEDERRAAMKEYIKAVRESRLYAAERAMQSIEAFPVEGPAPPHAEAVRKELVEVRARLGEIRDFAASHPRRDQTIVHYLELLKRCKDCREALIALQTAPLDPPDPPEGLAIKLEGNRRLLSWKPPGAGKRPTSYVVQRSLTRPGVRPLDAPFTTIHEGDSLHVTDDEIAHVGSTIRYMVHGVVRGRLEHEGSTIRAYEIASRPASFPGVVVWQEVMNLRCARRDRALELSWHQPSGARQVLIERWPGGPGDQALGVSILPATSEGRLLDADVTEGMVFTYRVSCLYDGPDGEFRTPGVTLTDGLVAAPRPNHDKLAASFASKSPLSSHAE
jgi:hypothetical protein